jgi:hypothetical protein
VDDRDPRGRVRSPDSYEIYYQDQLERALEFQDFVADLLYKHGLPLVNYQSRKWQIARGENRTGVEIKLDRRHAETGNLYIETAEKAHPSRPTYSPSGIYRGDAWLWAIGDTSRVYVFAVTMLQLLHRSGRYRGVQTATSKGFLLPLTDAAKYAARVLVPGDDGAA